MIPVRSLSRWPKNGREGDHEHPRATGKWWCLLPRGEATTERDEPNNFLCTEKMQGSVRRNCKIGSALVRLSLRDESTIRFAGEHNGDWHG